MNIELNHTCGLYHVVLKNTYRGWDELSTKQNLIKDRRKFLTKQMNLLKKFNCTDTKSVLKVEEQLAQLNQIEAELCEQRITLYQETSEIMREYNAYIDQIISNAEDRAYKGIEPKKSTIDKIIAFTKIRNREK